MKNSKKSLSILLTFIMTFSLMIGGLTTAFAAGATGMPTSSAAADGYFNASELTPSATIDAPLGTSGAAVGDTIQLLVDTVPIAALNHILIQADIDATTYSFAVSATDLGVDGVKVITTRIGGATPGPESPPLNVTMDTTAPTALSKAVNASSFNVVSATSITVVFSENLDVSKFVTSNVNGFAVGGGAAILTDAQLGADGVTVTLTGTNFVASTTTVAYTAGTLTDLAGNALADITATMASNAAPTASAVTITGTATVGQTLTGSYTYADADGDVEGTSTYQWYAGATPITGANAISYVLTSAEQGAIITFEVTPVATTGTATGTPVTSTPTAAVAAAPDTTAPLLSMTSASAVTDTTATLNFTSDEVGTYYYLVYAVADPTPNAATIKAQGAAVAKGTAAALAAANTANVTGMTASTGYNAYVIVEDASLNASAVSTIAVTTTAAPAVTSVTVTPATATVVQGGMQQLTATVAVVGGAAQTVDWTSSDVSGKVFAATDGLVTVAADAVAGTYTITATSTVDGSKTDTSVITVADTTAPTLSAVTAGPVVIGDNVAATSDEAGSLYLVPSATAAVKADIEAAGIIANGTKVAATATVSANLSTTGFAAGTYVVYAIDAAGNVSTGSTAITVNAITPVQDVVVAATAVNVGDALSLSTLSGTFKVSATDATAVAGTLTWDAPTTVVNATGNFAWTFTPTDTSTYTVVIGTVSVTANPVVAVTGVALDQPTLALTAGGATGTLVATTTPANATDQSVTWASDTVGVATVDNAGVVTGVSAGTAIITVTTTDGGFIATSTVTVTAANNAPTVATVIADTIGTAGGAVVTVDASSTFADADGDTLIISVASGTPLVATVAMNVNGTTVEITPLTAGTATITVTADDGKGGTVTDMFDIVVAADTTAPVITLTGNATVNVANGATYTDAGATASDNIDGDITLSIATTITNNVDGLGTFDNTKAATYTYHYNVSDAASNAATEVNRTVVVAAPVTLSSIAITAPATKLIYTVGEVLDISGMEVTGMYSDSTTAVETITSTDVVGFDSSVPAVDQVLTITVSGQTTTYTVTINAPLSSAKAITTFSFDGLATAVTGMITGTDIALTVPNGTDVTVLVATFTNSTASTVTVNGTAQISGTTANDFTSLVSYLVTAEDGTTATYTVTVTVTPLDGTVPATAAYDLFDGITLDIAMTLNGNALTSIADGVGNLASTTDYTVTGNTVTLTETYMQTQAAGDVTLTFTFSAGATDTTVITVSDSTPAAIVKTALTDAISAANTNKGTAAVSADGSDVLPANKWVLQADMDTYTAAIAAAQIVADNATATQTEVNDAVATLGLATTAYNTAKANGTWVLDTSALDTAIAAANAAKVVVISADGTDVAVGTFWVTQTVNDALGAAITTAVNAKATATTDLEVTNAASALNGAVTTYNAAKVDGTQAVLDADLAAYNTALAAVAQVDYTVTSWGAYQLVVTANVVTVANTQAEVDAATTAITTAQADLERLVSSIADNNILLVGDYAFDLSDPANNKYDLNNFLVAAQTAYSDPVDTYHVYFRIGDAWYDIVSDSDMLHQITDLTTINNGGLFNYMNMIKQ